MKRLLRATKNLIQILRDIFDDWLTRGAGIVVVLIITIVIYNMRSNLTETHPLLGAMVYAMVPVLFIVGGVIFVMAILKFSKPEILKIPQNSVSPKTNIELSKPVADKKAKIGGIVSENE